MDPTVKWLWLGVFLLTVMLIVLMRTRWGQSKPLRKCIILSLSAHVLLAGYTTTVRIAASRSLPGDPPIQVTFVEGPTADTLRPEEIEPSENTPSERPWEQFPHQEVLPPKPIEPDRALSDDLPKPERVDAAKPTNLPPRLTPRRHQTAQLQPPGANQLPTAKPSEQRNPSRVAPDINVPKPRPRKELPLPMPEMEMPQRIATPTATAWSPSRAIPGVRPKIGPRPLVPVSQLTQNAATEPLRSIVAPASDDAYGSPSPRDQSDRPVADLAQLADDPTEISAIRPAGELPELYRLRITPDRTEIARDNGATRASEAAVEAALKWLAENQMPDGHWDAASHGAGQTSGDDRDRLRAGIDADTGISGLALLAFLAAGHTHREGIYRENVRLGLQYLLISQADDGNLAGDATPFAKMYCHSMATFALSEAYGMTSDRRLRESVRRAVAYTVAAQDPSSGGWRYQPGDPGDTSQAGWQLMALKSADLAGIPFPTSARNGLIRYLQSVCSGEHGGLASYRPGEQASRPMTAEAMACWQFLGLSREHPAGNEAGDYLAEEAPGTGKTNLYYWYYATMTMYQLQGDYWTRWNEALQSTLIASQRRTGSRAGSWDPDTVWGGYGGRVYSTALATLSLEVYYRYLPLYAKTPTTEGRSARAQREMRPVTIQR